MMSKEDQLRKEGEAYRAKHGLAAPRGSSAGGEKDSSALARSMGKLSVSDRSAFSSATNTSHQGGGSTAPSRSAVCVTPPIDQDPGGRPSSKSNSFKPLMSSNGTTNAPSTNSNPSAGVAMRQSVESIRSSGSGTLPTSSQLNIDLYNRQQQQQQQQPQQHQLYQQQQIQQQSSRPSSSAAQSALSRQGSNRSAQSTTGGGGSSPIRYGGASSIVVSGASQPHNYYSNYTAAGSAGGSKPSQSGKYYSAASTKR
jgi:hypothetical protein